MKKVELYPHFWPQNTIEMGKSVAIQTENLTQLQRVTQTDEGIVREMGKTERSQIGGLGEEKSEI